MKKIDTWYVLVDGTHADPAEVSMGKDGILRHKDGVAVALRDSGVPLTSGVATKSNKQAAESGAESEGAKAKAAAPQGTSKEMRPEKEPKAPYKTRESKAE